MIRAADLETRFVGASQLFGAYFHQDWRKESPTPDENVRRFALSESDSVRRRAIKDIEELLTEYTDEDELGKVLMKFGNHYDALREEASYKEWLGKVLGILRFARRDN